MLYKKMMIEQLTQVINTDKHGASKTGQPCVGVMIVITNDEYYKDKAYVLFINGTIKETNITKDIDINHHSNQVTFTPIYKGDKPTIHIRDGIPHLIISR